MSRVKASLSISVPKHIQKGQNQEGLPRLKLKDCLDARRKNFGVGGDKSGGAEGRLGDSLPRVGRGMELRKFP